MFARVNKTKYISLQSDASLCACVPACLITKFVYLSLCVRVYAVPREVSILAHGGFPPSVIGTVHRAERICGNWRRGKAKPALQPQMPKPSYKEYDEGNVKKNFCTLFFFKLRLYSCRMTNLHNNIIIILNCNYALTCALTVAATFY